MQTLDQISNKAVELIGTESVASHFGKLWDWSENRVCYGNPEVGFPWFQTYLMGTGFDYKCKLNTGRDQ